MKTSALILIAVLISMGVSAQVSRLDMMSDVDDSTKVPKRHQWWVAINFGVMENIETVNDPNNLVSPLTNPVGRVGLGVEHHGTWSLSMDYHYYPLWVVLGLNNPNFGGGGSVSGTDAVHNFGVSMGPNLHPSQTLKGFSLRPSIGMSLSLLPNSLFSEDVPQPSGWMEAWGQNGEWIFGTETTIMPNFVNVLNTVALEAELKLVDIIGISLQPYYSYGWRTQYENIFRYQQNGNEQHTATLISKGSNAGVVCRIKVRIWTSHKAVSPLG